MSCGVKEGVRRRLPCTAPPSTEVREEAEIIFPGDSSSEEGSHSVSLRRSPQLSSLQVNPVVALVTGQHDLPNKSVDEDVCSPDLARVVSNPAPNVENLSNMHHDSVAPSAKLVDSDGFVDSASFPALDVENPVEDDLVELDISGLLTRNLDTTDCDFEKGVDESKGDTEEEEEEEEVVVEKEEEEDLRHRLNRLIRRRRRIRRRMEIRMMLLFMGQDRHQVILPMMFLPAGWLGERTIHWIGRRKS